MAQGWAYLAVAMENDGWLGMNQVKRVGKGYLAQEIERLMKQAEPYYK